MLSRKDNDYLCRIGPGTPMGNVLRRFWTPVCLAADIPQRDGPPRPLRVFGEDFVAFRDTNGAVGVINERCMHRGASMAMARVEDCGIRCLYHGWKFSVDGTIQETPNIRETAIKDKMKAPIYPAREAGGLIWAYFGPKDKEPVFPQYTWMFAESQPRKPVNIIFECNWVQLIEGSIDSSHLGVLHNDELTEARTGAFSKMQAAEDTFPTDDRAPLLEIENTDFGFHYAAIRDIIGDNKRQYVRVTPYILPYMTFTPPGRAAVIHVPIDDLTTAQYAIGRWADGDPPPEAVRFFGVDRPGVGTWGPDRVWRLPPQNREAMARGESFSGFSGIIPQDMAVTLTQGRLYDRENEHVTSSDIAAIRMRRLLIESARRVEEGKDPLGLHTSVDTLQIQGGAGPLDRGVPWQSLVPGNVRRSPEGN
jgi:phthalate 4,5-dioxygenase oxygenase subunit